jgi:hypothetical protein
MKLADNKAEKGSKTDQESLRMRQKEEEQRGLSPK